MNDITILGNEITKGRALAMGNFDGLHLGHQDVLHAAQSAGDFALLSFSPHPRRFFSPDSQPFELSTDTATMRVAKSLGASSVHFVQFDQALSKLSPEEFLEALTTRFAPSLIAVGEDFSFGAKKAGDSKLLESWCADQGIATKIVPLKFDDGEKISSSAVRDALLSGNPERAQKLLGRPHMIEGIVTQGDQRGRDLGFPTANLYPEVMLPKFGIYATRLEVMGGAHAGKYLGASSLGIRPSFGINKPNFETHILDFEGDIYGEEIRVELVEYLRPEVKFEGIDKLIEQMKQDVIKCREILNA